MADTKQTGDFLGQVEEAWYERTKGDLALTDNDDPMGYDADLAGIVSSLAEYARENIATVGAAQHGPGGLEIPGGIVSDDELARRIVAALDIVLYGGPA